MPTPRSAGSGSAARSAIGRRVRDLRVRRAVTLRQLAARLGVSPATLSAIENGHTGLSSVRLAHVAELLEVPVEELFAPPAAAPGAWAPRAAAGGARSPAPGARGPAAPGGPGSAAPGRPDPAASGGPDPTDPGVAGRSRLDWRVYPPLTLDPPLAAALSAFLEFGYHGATMRHIAQRAGLSVPGVYHYYSSKQDMLVAILDLTMHDLHGRAVAARAEGRDPVERFALLVECLALYHTHRRELGFVGASEMRSLLPPARERVATARRAQQRMVDEEVEQAAAAGVFATDRPHEAARAVVTMCTALPQWFSPAGPKTAEEVAEQYVQFALALVGCTASRRRTRLVS